MRHKFLVLRLTTKKMVKIGARFYRIYRKINTGVPLFWTTQYKPTRESVHNLNDDCRSILQCLLLYMQPVIMICFLSQCISHTIWIRSVERGVCRTATQTGSSGYETNYDRRPSFRRRGTSSVEQSSSVRHRLLVSWHLQKISQDLFVFSVILEHRTAHYWLCKAPS